MTGCILIRLCRDSGQIVDTNGHARQHMDTHMLHSPDNCWTAATDVLNSGATVNANNIAEYDWTIAGQIVDRM